MYKLIFVIPILAFSLGLHAQKAEQILEKHFQVTGQQIWDQVESVIVDGKWVTEDFKNYPIKITYKQPEKIRIEGMWNRKKFVEASDGKLAWIIAPWTGTSQVQLMTPLEQLIITHAYTLGSPLKPYEKELKFKGLVSFKDELLLNFTYETAFISKEFYIGQKDHRLYWEVVETKAGSRRYKIEKQFEKYRIYNSLLVPTSVRIYSEKGERELIFDDVTLGAGAANRLFIMPEKKNP